MWGLFFTTGSGMEYSDDSGALRWLDEMTPRGTWLFVVAYILYCLTITAASLVYVELKNIPSTYITLPTPDLLETAPRTKLDERLVTCLAKNIYFESRNQNEEDMVAVGFVPVNRLEKHRWAKRADDVCDIIYQRNQFSWYWDGKPDRPEPGDIRIWYTSIRIAEQILRGELPDPTNGADHYHAWYVSPDWKNQYEFVAQFDAHLFYNSTL